MKENTNKYDAYVNDAAEKFKALMYEQLQRVEKINASKDFVDYSKLDKIVIGVTGGDGIGPTITNAAADVMQILLADEIKNSNLS